MEKLKHTTKLVELIREYMDATGKNQQSTANEFGISQSLLSKIVSKKPNKNLQNISKTTSEKIKKSVSFKKFVKKKKTNISLEKIIQNHNIDLQSRKELLALESKKVEVENLESYWDFFLEENGDIRCQWTITFLPKGSIEMRYPVIISASVGANSDIKRVKLSETLRLKNKSALEKIQEIEIEPYVEKTSDIYTDIIVNGLMEKSLLLIPSRWAKEEVEKSALNMMSLEHHLLVKFNKYTIEEENKKHGWAVEFKPNIIPTTPSIIDIIQHSSIGYVGYPLTEMKEQKVTFSFYKKNIPKKSRDKRRSIISISFGENPDFKKLHKDKIEPIKGYTPLEAWSHNFPKSPYYFKQMLVILKGLQWYTHPDIS